MTEVLIGRKLGDVEALDEQEYRVLSAALRMLRSGDEKAAAILHAVEDCERRSQTSQVGTLELFFDELLEALGSHVEQFQGLLYVRETDEIALMNEDLDGSRQAETLWALWKVLQAKNWLGEFLALQLPLWAKKCPQPSAVAYWVAEQVGIFDSNLTDAQGMLRDWPELFDQKPRSAAAGEGA